MKTKKTKMKKTFGERLFQSFSTILLVLVMILILYPIIYVVSASVSSAQALSAGRVFLFPIDMTLAGYKFVMQYSAVWVGYRNTILYTLVGVTNTMVLTLCCAYPLSKRNYQGRKLMTWIFTFTMMVGAGLIPTFLVYVKLGLYGTPFAVILWGALGISNVLIMRTAFAGVPDELYEAAQIDGASDLRQFATIGIPLCKATISVIIFYSLVGAWNDYFAAMIMLTDSNMFPLQLVLRTILTATETLDMSSVSGSALQALNNTGMEQVKYALIVISTVPVIAIYGVVQKSFKGGVMIGAVKG